MIIDVHTHTPTHRGSVPDADLVINRVWRPDRPVRATTSWDDFAAAADEGAVGVSIVFNIAVKSPMDTTGIPTDPARVNDSTAEFVRDEPTRRIGFLSVHPEVPGAREEIERCVGDLGLRGIKLGPNYQDFDPLGSPASAVYEQAQARGLPILFHGGASPIRSAPLRYAHPLVFDEIAIRFPDLRMVIAHLGHPWQADTLVVIRKHPNVFADLSASFYRPYSHRSAMRLAVEWGVLDKLLFASDFPVTTPVEAAAGLRSLAVGPREDPPVLDDAAVASILDRDSLALLGLDRPG